ncbi:protein phosphatase 2c domain-containing protein [Cystoisospora suis]|uniref:Protein phosphatase 2c domain-containing protein n=1 Tax=Cystoisospora suis TaxID=483139 RepID=A0A2C6LD82_9APIC|nr:protein phosphatase 2c domain-containing protein [Cystoisospora suis]
MIKTERHGMEGRCEDSSLWMRREKERNCTQSDRSHLSPWQEGRIRASVVNTRIGSSFLRNRSLSIVRHLGESRVCRDIVGVGEEDQSLPFISPLHHSLRWKLSSSRALPRLENETSLMLSPPGSSYSFLSSRQHFPPSASGLVTGKISARTQGNFDSRNTGDSGKAGDDKGHSSSIRPGNKTEPQTKPADVATSACATSLTASPPSVGGISVDDETHEGSGGVTRDVVPCNPSEESLPSVPPSTGASSEGTNSSMGASVANSPATSETPAPTMRACQAAAGASTDPEDKKTGISDRRLDGVLENSEKLSFLEGTRGKRRLSGVASSDKNHPISTTVEGDVAEAVAMAPVGSEGGESRPRVVPPVKGKSSADPKKQPHRQCKRAEIKPDERTTTLERGGEGGCHGVPRGGSVLSEPSPPLVSRSSETLSRDAAAPHTCSGPLTNGPKVHACRPQRLLVAHGMTRGMRSVPSICRVGAEGKARFSESLGDGGLQKQAFADEDEKVLLYKAREYLLRHPRGDRPQIVIPHTGTPTPGRRELDADEQKTKNSFIKGQSKPAEPQKLLCTYMEGEFQLVATTRLVDSPAPSAWFRLAPGVPGRLRPGDEIRMGSLELAVLRFNTGVGSQQGFRGTMEDEEVVLQDLAVSDAFYCSFFAVHDGHGGRDCAQFVKRQLHLRFRHQLLRLCGRLELSNAVDTHVHAALAEAFLKTDDAYLASQRGLGLRTTSGCATVVVVIVGGALWTANCGDARAVLSRRGRAIQLSADHKPHRRDEMQRIVAAGGFVRCRRVLGRLAVSRAFGDSEYKGFQRWDREGIDESTWEWPSCEGATGGGEGCMDGCERMHGEGGQRRAERSRKDQNRKMSSILGHQATQKDVSVNGQATEKGTDFLYRAPLVTASPEIRKEALTEDDEFLLLACDGLFDVFTSQEAVTFIRERLATMPEAEQDPQIVVNELIREAIEERKSRDNVTAILVTFRSDVGCRRKTV